MDKQAQSQALRHLQITFTTKEYQTIIRQYTKDGLFRYTRAEDEYWGRLPSYVIARCPICNAPYTSLLDTHSLAGGWSTHPDFYKSVYSQQHQYIGCTHFVAVQKFVNLNAILPTELTYFSSNLDMPFVMPVFLADDIPSFGVMHSVPICSIEDGVFVPRYTAFFITYYSSDPSTLWQRRKAEETHNVAEDPEYRMTMLYPSWYPWSRPELWDLALWVERKKLQWLDLAASELPLKAAPVQDFPYTDIQGYRQPFTIRKGKLELQLNL